MSASSIGGEARVPLPSTQFFFSHIRDGSHTRKKKRNTVALFPALYVRAYLSLLRKMRHRGRHSRCLWGPGLGLGAKTPPSLSSIQCLGALSRLRCFLGPRGTIGRGRGRQSGGGEKLF